MLSLIAIIVFLSLAAIAFVLFHSLVYNLKRTIPVKDSEETYYYIPEIKLYIKMEGMTLRLSEYPSSLKSGQKQSMDFYLRNNLWRSTIYYPIDNCNKVFINDSHNCLTVLRKSDSVERIYEKNLGFVPPSVEIQLPISKVGLEYRLPDGTLHQALIMDGETVFKDKDLTNSQEHQSEANK